MLDRARAALEVDESNHYRDSSRYIPIDLPSTTSRPSFSTTTTKPEPLSGPTLALTTDPMPSTYSTERETSRSFLPPPPARPSNAPPPSPSALLLPTPLTPHSRLPKPLPPPPPSTHTALTPRAARTTPHRPRTPRQRTLDRTPRRRDPLTSRRERGSEQSLPCFPCRTELASRLPGPEGPEHEGECAVVLTGEGEEVDCAVSEREPHDAVGIGEEGLALHLSRE